MGLILGQFVTAGVWYVVDFEPISKLRLFK